MSAAVSRKIVRTNDNKPPTSREVGGLLSFLDWSRSVGALGLVCEMLVSLSNGNPPGRIEC